MSETGSPQTRRPALEWGTVLLLLALLVWYPLYRTPFPVGISYNEGWNAYHGAWTTAGGLYREPPRFSTAFMRELLESYRLDRRDSSLAFLVPKEVAP